MMRQGLASSALAAVALALAAAPAGAHGGDAALVHSCIDNGGNVRIVAADASCKQNEVALDWARDAGGGEAPELTWGNLTGIPSDLLNGDDDGSAAVGVLRSELAHDDGMPNAFGDPVSFSKIKDLTSSVSGDGRITGEFVRDGSIESQDIRDGTITASDLAGSDAAGAIVVGAVTSEKISDGTIQARDLASGVLDRIMTAASIDLREIQAGERAVVSVPLAGVDPLDIVVVSPPESLHSGLVFAGSDVQTSHTLTLYLHNITAETIDAGSQTWTVRQLRTGG